MSELRRLFFGITIPPRIQRQLVGWRADHFPPEAGKPVAAASMHMTLAFLGEVSMEKSEKLIQQAGRIKQPAFTLNLDDAGHWPRSKVVWLGTRQPPRRLIQLAELLRSQAARSGCWQSPQPFHPHITLYRQAASQVKLPPPGFSWSFPVTEFTLFESVVGRGRTRYQPLQSWAMEEEGT